MLGGAFSQDALEVAGGATKSSAGKMRIRRYVQPMPDGSTTVGTYCELRAMDADADPAQLLASGKATSTVSLEKAWHGLHFLLTGTAMEGDWPLHFLLLGGQPLEDEESTRRLSPESVREVHRALAPISEEQLWQRFDPEQMSSEGVYPEIWDEPEADLKEEYLMYFQEMKGLIGEAAAVGKAVLISIG